MLTIRTQNSTYVVDLEHRTIARVAGAYSPLPLGVHCALVDLGMVHTGHPMQFTILTFAGEENYRTSPVKTIDLLGLPVVAIESARVSHPAPALV